MTTDERIENLEKGLASARRFNRWLLAAVGLALGVWILAGTFGPTMAAAPASGGAAKEVRANRFVVEDANGKVRAELNVSKDGSVLGLRDENGKPRIVLGVVAGLKDEPMLCLSDENGKPRAALSVTKDGPVLSLFDSENEKPLVTLQGTKVVALTLRDENGTDLARLLTGKSGALLQLSDENGKPRAELNVSKAGSLLGLRDENGKLRAWLNVFKDGPTLNLSDENEKPRVWLDVSKDGPKLDLSDEKGKTIWQAPQSAPVAVTPGTK